MTIWITMGLKEITDAFGILYIIPAAPALHLFSRSHISKVAW